MDLPHVEGETIRDQIKRRVSEERHRDIRRLWMAHSIAEDARDIPGLIATLTPDCVYTVVPTGKSYHGHEGAERFYTDLLTAAPDVHFDLQNIVIGPQGIWEEAHVTGTWAAPWMGYMPENRTIDAMIQIFFPYDLERKLFTGERVFFEAAKLLE